MRSLYLHIPFCTTRCAYCTFYSEVYRTHSQFIEPYYQRLLAEVDGLVSKSDEPFDTVYLGGGNPGLLGYERLKTLLQRIQIHGRSREVTMEINPETLNESFFSLFEEGLLTRLSIGIQSMDDRFLQRIGRNTTKAMNERALLLAEKIRSMFGVEVTFDLIVAIPGQTVEDVVKDINSVLSLCKANHVSLYCLTVEEGSRLFEEGGVFMSEDDQAKLLYGVWEYLASLGFEHYEVSNFAKDQHYSQHNLVYWRLGEYIGLGSSAASTLFEGGTLVHYTQEQSAEEYGFGRVGSGYEKEVLTIAERIEEEIMVGLRTAWGIDKQIFLERTGYDFTPLFSTIIAKFDSLWYTDSSQFFILTEIGFMVLDTILLRFFERIAQALDRP